jgi:hypothetical protein
VGIEYPAIRSFSDACCEAWAMRERFAYVHAAFGLDADGNVRNGVALTLKHRHTHDSATTSNTSAWSSSTGSR